MGELGRTLERAEAMLNRARSESTGIAKRGRRRRLTALIRRLKLAFMAALTVMVAAAAIGMIHPLGIGGFFLAVVAMAVVASTILLWPSRSDATPEALIRTDLPQLPQRTDEWLEAQRPALPAPAIRLVDGIGARLDALAPQLVAIDPQAPLAMDLRKLMAEELPELVAGYRRVPGGLRGDERNGPSPDRQLVDGLTVVDQELSRISDQLARGDLDRLATQNRYLELKYREPGA